MCVFVCVTGGTSLPGGPTCRCLSVKTTGSVRNTRLDSLMEAAITWLLTARPRPLRDWPVPGSSSIFTVAFSVDRKAPRFLYRTNTTFTGPAPGTDRDEITGDEKRERDGSVNKIKGTAGKGRK